MSRLYLTLLILLFSVPLYSQQELKKYLSFAQQKYAEGDYIYALEYYQKAMQIDSNSINTLWEYAETLRAYKDYPKAAFYYKKVFEREDTQLYPASLLQYGLMLKQTGDYEKALTVFKQAKKKYRKDSRSYLSQKSRAEIESCIWAKSNQDIVSDQILEALPEHINSKNAEFGHRVYKKQLIFSSLRADSISQNEEIYDPTYKTHLYSSEIKNGIFTKEQKIKNLNWENANSGNGSFSLDGKRFYFSHCQSDGHNYSCKILVAYIENNQFKDIDTLGNIINMENANTTMPFIGEWDGEEVLFYASNREGSVGGMDIWYSFIREGNQFSKPVNAKPINTLDNELSPFWDGKTNTLYFSSSWHNGFGGQDVFKSVYDNRFQPPENMMPPINSPANDLYYFQTSTKDTAYFSSNRLGSNYSKNPTCCSDIYMLRKEIAPEPPTIEETLEDLNKRLPVTLYFHNDIPNPRSTDTVTRVNYMDSYRDYIGMMERYKKEYAAGLSGENAEDAKDDIEDFFTEFVEQGVKDLTQFQDLLLKELEKGRKIEMTVKGFASPLAKTDYNAKLTKRRIGALVNYLNAYKGGVFRKYLSRTAKNGGELIVKQIPFGEYSADQFISDNPNDKKNSIYSRTAAGERKIEIQSVDILRKEDLLSTLLTANTLVFDVGKQKPGTIIEKEFTLKNVGELPIKITEILPSSTALSSFLEKEELMPQETTPIKIIFDTKDLIGHQVGTVEIRYNEVEKGLVLTILTILENE